MDFRMKVSVWWVIVVFGEAGVARPWRNPVHEAPGRQMGERGSQDLINGPGNVARTLRDHTLSYSRAPRGINIFRPMASPSPDPLARASRAYLFPPGVADEGTPHNHTTRPEEADDDEASGDHTARSEAGPIIPHDRSMADARTLRDHVVVEVETPHDHTASSVTGARVLGDHSLRPDSETLGPHDPISPPVTNGGTPHHRTASASDDGGRAREEDGGSGLAIASKPPREPHVRNRSRLLRHSLKKTWKSHNHRQHQMNRTDPHTTGGSSASGDVRKNGVLTPHSIGKSLQSVRRAPEFNNSEPKHPDDKSQEDSNLQPESRERKRLELKNPESQYPERRPSGAKDGETQHPERKDRKVKHPDLRVAREFKLQRPHHPGMKPPFAGSLGTQELEKKPSEARHHQPSYSQSRLSYSGTGSSVVRSRKSSSSAKTPTYVGSRRPQDSGEKPTDTRHLKAQYPNTNPSDSNQQEAQGKRPQEFKHLEAQNMERNPSNLRQSEKKPQEIRDADQQYLERGSSEVRRLDPRHLRTELSEEIHQSSQILTEKPQNVKYQEVAYRMRLPSGVRYLDPQPAERRPSEDTFPEQEQQQQQLQEIYLQPQFNEERYLQPQFHEERYPEVRYFETQQPMEQPTDVWNPGDPEPQYPRYETPLIRYLQLQQPDLKAQEVRYLDLQQPDLKPQEVRYLDLQQPDLKPQEVRYLELEQPDTQPQEVRYLDLQQPDTQPKEVGYPGPPLPQRRPIEARYQNPELWTGSLDDSDIMLTESHRRIRRAQASGPIDSQHSENKRHLRILSRSGSPSEGYQLGKRAQMEKYFRLLRSAERPEGGEVLGEQNTGGSSRFKIVYEPVYGIRQAPDGSRPANVKGSDVNLLHQYPRPVRISVDDNRNKPPTDEYRYPGIMVTLKQKDQSPDGPVRRASAIDSKVSSDPRLRDDVNQASHTEGILFPTYSTHQQPSGEATAWIDGSPAASASHRRVPHHGNDIPRLPGNFDRIKYNHTDVHTVGIPQREMNGSVYPNVFKQQRPRLKDNVHFAGAPLPASYGSQVPLRHYYLMGVPHRGQAKKVSLPRRDVDRILNPPVATESIIATTRPRIVPKQAMHLIDFLKTSDDDDVPTRPDSIKWLTKTTSESGKAEGHDNMNGYGTARINDSDISDGYGNSTVAGLTSDRGLENCTWPCDSTPGDGNGTGVIDSNATEDSGLEEIIPKVSGDFPSAVIGPRHSKDNSSYFIGSNPFGLKASDDHKSEGTSPKDFGSDGSKTSEATDSRDSEAGTSPAYDKPDASDDEEAKDPGKENSENPDTKDPIRLEPEDSSRTSVDHDINDGEGNSGSAIIADRDSKSSKNIHPTDTQVNHDDKPGSQDDGLKHSPATDERESRGSDDGRANNATSDGKSLALVDGETEDFRNGIYEASRRVKLSNVSGNDTNGVSRDTKLIFPRVNVSKNTVKDKAGMPGNGESGNDKPEVSGNDKSRVSASANSEATERDEYDVSRDSTSVSESDEAKVSETDKSMGSEGNGSEVSGKGKPKVSERDESKVSIGESQMSDSGEQDSSENGRDVISRSESRDDESDGSGNDDSKNIHARESKSSTKESQNKQNHEVDHDYAKKSSDDKDDDDDGDDDDDEDDDAEGSPDKDDGNKDSVQNDENGDSLDNRTDGDDDENSPNSSEAIASVSLMVDEKERKDLIPELTNIPVKIDSNVPLDEGQTVKDTISPSKDNGNIKAVYDGKAVSLLNKRLASLDKGDDVSLGIAAATAEENGDTSLEKDSPSANDYSESALGRDKVSAVKDTSNVFDSEISNRSGKNVDGVVVLDNITDASAASGEGGGESDNNDMVGQKVILDLANDDGETPSGKEDAVISTEKGDGSVDTEKEDGSLDTEEEDDSVDTEKENESLGKKNEDYVKENEELAEVDGRALTDEDRSSIAEEGGTTGVEDAGVIDEGSGASVDVDAGPVSEDGRVRREGKSRQEVKLIKMNIWRGYRDVLNRQK